MTNTKCRSCGTHINGSNCPHCDSGRKGNRLLVDQVEAGLQRDSRIAYGVLMALALLVVTTSLWP